jgi:peptide chain release factor 2
LRRKSRSFGGDFDIDTKKERISALDLLTSSATFWADPEKAQSVFKERASLQAITQSWQKQEADLQEAKLFLELGEEDNDQEAISEARAKIVEVESQLKRMEWQLAMGGEHDQGNAIATIHPGAGGTEAQDWADMLLRMYLRWADRRGFRAEILEYQPGEEAGLKSATFSLSGEYAYGYLKAEAGIHRLVRISPFDANSRRHTSFASLFVFPEIDDRIDVEINEADLRIDTYRSSGAGGQHVNKTDSAVRITHIPTGIVVACQNERSQHKNKAMAMKVLRSRLYELEQEKQKEKMESLHKTKKEIAWGSQIRSYVLHPYRLVKDHRTGREIGNTDAVLDGDIDTLIESYLFEKTMPEGASDGAR